MQRLGTTDFLVCKLTFFVNFLAGIAGGMIEPTASPVGRPAPEARHYLAQPMRAGKAMKKMEAPEGRHDLAITGENF
jgi:hypothetical protein